jgi:hypothetical protein
MRRAFESTGYRSLDRKPDFALPIGAEVSGATVPPGTNPVFKLYCAQLTSAIYT